MSLIRNSLLMFFLSAVNLVAQVDFLFLKHLSTSNLKTEHYHYLLNECKNKDTLNYLLTKYYLQYEKDSLFFSYYLKSKSISVNDSNLINCASIYFFKQITSSCFQWKEKLEDNYLINSSQYQFINAVNDEKMIHLNYGNALLQNDFYEYKKSLKKNPLIAASLSAIIPGLGKAYLHSYRSFAITLFTHVMYGLQLNESVKKFGLKHPLTIANIALFSVFYSSNIYGSFTETKKRKKEKLYQLLHDASDHFYINNGNSLYP